MAKWQTEARSKGSFVERALVREIKVASERFSPGDPAWVEVAALVSRWEKGMPDIQVLEAVRRINRAATCWRAEVNRRDFDGAGVTRPDG